ncbi:unnamed protein product [Cylindrotheca closterium]|uniref:L domain-like protein n=1 Tax=Cylindrotheca closterium TaxID=2856 RepID=A0AAD2PVC2_9STRA|nr:unnamed protein product [Cylindrotheca closterium]
MKLFNKKNGADKADKTNAEKKKGGNAFTRKFRRGGDAETGTVATGNTANAENPNDSDSPFAWTVSYLASFMSVEVGLPEDEGVDVKHSLPVPPTKEELDEIERKKRNRKILLAILLLAFLGVIAFLVVFFLLKKDPNPLARSRIEILEDVLGSNVSPLEQLRDNSTVQHEAIMWFANDDPTYPELENVSEDLIVARYVSALLYMSTGGPEWRQQLNFMSDSSVCEWNDGGAGEVEEGIVCDSDDAGRVDGIVVDINNLVGTLPTELAALPYLKTLGLASNKFVGTLPPEYGEMSSLIYLGVSGNALTGSLPEELRKLTRLNSLNVHWNQFTGTVPTAYGEMTSLKVVHLEGNDLQGNLERSLCGRASPYEEFMSDCATRPAGNGQAEFLAEVTCFCCTECCFDGAGCRTLDTFNFDN